MKKRPQLSFEQTKRLVVRYGETILKQYKRKIASTTYGVAKEALRRLTKTAGFTVNVTNDNEFELVFVLQPYWDIIEYGWIRWQKMPIEFIKMYLIHYSKFNIRELFDKYMRWKMKRLRKVNKKRIDLLALIISEKIEHDGYILGREVLIDALNDPTISNMLMVDVGTDFLDKIASIISKKIENFRGVHGREALTDVINDRALSNELVVALGSKFLDNLKIYVKKTFKDKNDDRPQVYQLR